MAICHSDYSYPIYAPQNGNVHLSTGWPGTISAIVGHPCRDGMLESHVKSNVYRLNSQHWFPYLFNDFLDHAVLAYVSWIFCPRAILEHATSLWMAADNHSKADSPIGSKSTLTLPTPQTGGLSIIHSNPVTKCFSLEHFQKSHFQDVFPERNGEISL